MILTEQLDRYVHKFEKNINSPYSVLSRIINDLNVTINKLHYISVTFNRGSPTIILEQPINEQKKKYIPSFTQNI